MNYDLEPDEDPRVVRNDVLAYADWLRDQLKNSSSCRTCGSPDPAIISGAHCSDCPDEGPRVRMSAHRHDPDCPCRLRPEEQHIPVRP